MIKCELCSLWFEEITWSHLKYSHGITTFEYEQRFPGADLVPLSLAIERGNSISRQRQENPRTISTGHIAALRKGHKEFLEDLIKYWTMVGHCIENNGRYERSEEMRLERGKITERIFQDPDVRKRHSENVSKGLTGVSKSPDHIQHISDALKQVYKEGRGGFQKTGWVYTKERNKKVSKGQKELWDDPEYRNETVKAMFRGRGNKPTEPEMTLLYFLDRNFTNEWKYNGVWELDPACSVVVLGGRVPDFIRTDSKKLVIEVFGEYWHSLNPDDKTSEKATVEHYDRLGYKCLVLWDYELYSQEYVVSKVNELMGKLVEIS